MRRILLTVAIMFVCLPAAAQPLKLAFNEGRVSLDATNVPVRTILAEWGKLGGTKVIGAERIAGSPLTLKLENVTESQALEIVLRSVAGYMAAPRRAAAEAGASTYDRILILATSVIPPPVAARPVANQGGNSGPANNQRFVPPRIPARQVDQDDEPEEEPDQNPPNAPVFTFPQPGQQGAQPGVFQGLPAGQNGQPIMTINPNTGAPQSITISPVPNSGAVPTFGAPMPGMIVVPPPLPGQPGVIVRPPGV